jgi:hypothetical protein
MLNGKDAGAQPAAGAGAQPAAGGAQPAAGAGAQPAAGAGATASRLWWRLAAAALVAVVVGVAVGVGVGVSVKSAESASSAGSQQAGVTPLTPANDTPSSGAPSSGTPSSGAPTSAAPTSANPTSATPTTRAPTARKPTVKPSSAAPTDGADAPTSGGPPSSSDTLTSRPSAPPTSKPSRAPTPRPSRMPSLAPTSRPSSAPTTPTSVPSRETTAPSSARPTRTPTTGAPTTASPTAPTAPVDTVQPIARDFETDFYALQCSHYLSLDECNGDRCHWSGGKCKELRCVSRMRWQYTGNPKYRLSSTIGDFLWHAESCPDLPFSTNNYPEGSATGSAPEPRSFDRDLSPGERLAWVASVDTQPYSVDVDLLTDDQIASSCLTVEQCVLPPLLTVVREAPSRTLWAPGLGSFRNGNKQSYKINGDDPKVKGNATGDNTNYQVIKRLPPLIADRYWDDVANVRQTFYPRGATAATAKLVRISFNRMGEPGRPLYSYLDMTCGAARKFSRRNGFLGQCPSRINGVFLEVMYIPSGNSPNSHGPMRADLGVTFSKADFGAGGSERIAGTFAFTGPNDGVSFRWTSLNSVWIRVGKWGPATMAAVYIKSAMEWAMLLPPRGNMALTVLFFYAAQVEFNKLPRGSTPDFAALERYSGQGYLEMKPALDYLVSTDPTTGKPWFMAVPLIGSQCMRALPTAFTRPFLGGIQAPEIACSGSSINCPAWCSLSCKPFWDVVRAARALVLEATIPEIPKCSRCPGLTGVFREDVPRQNELYEHSPFFPQCLPFQASDGTVYDDPVQLSGVKQGDGGSRRRRLGQQPQHDQEPAPAPRSEQDYLDILRAMYSAANKRRGAGLWQLPDIDVVDLLHEEDPRRRELLGNRTADAVRRELLGDLATADLRRDTSAAELRAAIDDPDFVDCKP